MDDIYKQVHEDNGAHTTIHGPCRALERLGAMTWRVETLFDPHLPKISECLGLDICGRPADRNRRPADRKAEQWFEPTPTG